MRTFLLVALATGVCALQATAQKIEFDFSSGINRADMAKIAVL